MSRQDLLQVSLPHERIVKSAPPGVLGGFIQRKLREYVEPTREGTPRGEPVGFSKAKYDAMVLSNLTALRLQSVAREAGVPYRGLKKWRTEESFLNAIDPLVEEFVVGPFTTAAIVALGIREGLPVSAAEQKWDKDIACQIKHCRLIGFEDAHYYDPMFLDMLTGFSTDSWTRLIRRLKEHEITKEPDEITSCLVAEYLAQTFLLGRIDRLRRTPAPRGHAVLTRIQKWGNEWSVKNRREIAQHLAIFIELILSERPAHPRFQYLAFLASTLVYDVLKN
ncbi:hypothetical protein MYX04_05795 [Nitrospiraceae bacterium AH_259_D15_M11_P09]|nr:hypothetical protein [Nitrospiraceae bacterium AH_259_D15_M11_P09]